MVNYIIFYVVGLLISTNIVFIWFNSPIKEYIISKIFKKTNDELIIQNPFWGKLLNCDICFSTWISFFASLIMLIFYPLGLGMLLLATFSYPFLIYILKSSAEKLSN